MRMKRVAVLALGLLASASFAGASGFSGTYFGINAGYGWGDQTVDYTPNDQAAFDGTCGGVGGGTCIPSATLEHSGAVAGVQLGHNWDGGGSWVFGIEGDASWAAIEGDSSSPFHQGSTQDSSADATLELEWLATLRARAGIATSPSMMIYATGGLAIGEVSHELVVPNNVIGGTGSQTSGGFSYRCTTAGPPCFEGSGSDTKTGWTLGAGAEFAVSPNVTMKLEYLYVDLGDVEGTLTTNDFVLGNTPASFNADFGSMTKNVVRVGVNFKL
jgi:outer membrane immunogenic protein